ncbi:MAG: ferritin [Tissierellia bacterium]|nr:ferritin [Tissierellia bacterium]
MISKDLEKLLNEQYNLELASGHAYLAMMAWFQDKSWDGFAHFMKLQAEEEYEHACKFFDFMGDTGLRTIVDAMPKPEADFASVRKVFEAALKHEQDVTAAIHHLYDKALEEKSFETMEFLHWFLKEQVEEEDTMQTILDKIDQLDGSDYGIYILDKELGQREE